MRTLGTPNAYVSLGGGAGGGEFAGATGELVPDGALVGPNVGNGRWRQIGTFGLSVGVATGTGVGRGGNGFGVGRGVGSGSGGTRGSGNRGSPAVDSAWARFQSGPYGRGVASGAGVTACGITDCKVCSVAWPMTRFPKCSPTATATSKTSAPTASKRAGSLFDGWRGLTL
jgi:hypothetical protein